MSTNGLTTIRWPSICPIPLALAVVSNQPLDLRCPGHARARKCPPMHTLQAVHQSNGCGELTYRIDQAVKSAQSSGLSLSLALGSKQYSRATPCTELSYRTDQTANCSCIHSSCLAQVKFAQVGFHLALHLLGSKQSEQHHAQS